MRTTLLPNHLLRAALPCATACLAALSATAQTAATTHTPVHHRVVHRAVATCAGALPAPVTPPGLPPATGPVQTAFALRYIDMVVGTGAVAQPGDTLTVQYTGWLASNGQKFDSSLDLNEPFPFTQGAHQVIPGWDEGFGGMRVGGKRRLFIPWQLAYGAAGRDPIPPKADLIFDIELISTSGSSNGEAAPPAPPQAATPPTGTPQ